jgi:trimeric autotransporter adhesin
MRLSIQFSHAFAVLALGTLSACSLVDDSFTLVNGGGSGSKSLTILTSLSITPANPVIHAGTLAQFTAMGTYSDGSTKDLTAQVQWASADLTAATFVSVGRASGVAAGSSTISAAFEGLSASTLLMVSSATLLSIAVTPATPSVPLGSTQAFTATGTYSDASTQDLTISVVWSRVNLTGAASIGSGTGIAATLGGALGTVTITATLGAVNGSTTLTVAPAALVNIVLTPATVTVIVGNTQAFTATGTYTDSSTQNLSALVTWISSAPAKATINGAGVATGVSAGSTTISIANYLGIAASNTCALTVATTPQEYLYTADSNGAGAVTAFQVTAGSGVPSKIADYPTAGTFSYTSTTSPNGKYLFAANTSSNTVAAPTPANGNVFLFGGSASGITASAAVDGSSNELLGTNFGSAFGCALNQ